jgi:putative intracellular protease/amidase
MTLVEKNTLPKRMNVAILIFNGVQIIDYTGPFEVFGQAGYNAYTVAEKADPIKTNQGMVVTPKYTFAKFPKPDVILLPGGAVGDQLENPAVIKWIQETEKDSSNVLTVCNGAFIAWKAGLLEGKEATTTSSLIGELQQVAKNTKVVSDKRYVDNGKIITTAGLSSGIDGALYLVSKLSGLGVAQGAALGMEYNWDPQSNYVRAALADKYLRFSHDGLSMQYLSRQGDRDHWENKWTVDGQASPEAVMEKLNGILASSAKWTRQENVPTDTKTKSVWSFKDESGKTWSGEAIVDKADAGRFVVAVKIARADSKAPVAGRR